MKHKRQSHCEARRDRRHGVRSPATWARGRRDLQVLEVQADSVDAWIVVRHATWLQLVADGEIQQVVVETLELGRLTVPPAGERAVGRRSERVAAKRAHRPLLHRLARTAGAQSGQNSGHRPLSLDKARLRRA